MIWNGECRDWTAGWMPWRRRCETGSKRSSPCTAMYAALFAFQGLRSQPLTASLLGEQVAEAQRASQVQQRYHVPRAGPHPLIPPAPYRVWVGSETAVQLRPREVRLLLEPHEPLREVVGEVVDSSAVVCTLSRHRARVPLGAQPATLSNASPGIVLPVGPRPRPLRFRVRYACLTRPCIRACSFRCPECQPLVTAPASPPGLALPG